MHVLIIVNPHAGSGRALKAGSKLARDLADLGEQVRLVETMGPADARRLICEESEDVDVILAVGGDGTLHQVANGLLASESTAALGVVPAGSGNDFARLIGMPRHAREWASAVLGGEIRMVDVGQIEWNDAYGKHSAYFLNAAGCGIDAAVADRARSIKYLRGLPRYMAAVFQSLRQWEHPVGQINLINADDEEVSFSMPILLTTVGNGRTSGGGFMLTPLAEINDGLLDVCLVPRIPLSRILYLLPRLPAGGHLGAKEITYAQASTTRMTFQQPVSIHLDGEIVSRSATEIVVTVRSRFLRLWAPKV